MSLRKASGDAPPAYKAVRIPSLAHDVSTLCANLCRRSLLSFPSALSHVSSCRQAALSRTFQAAPLLLPGAASLTPCPCCHPKQPAREMLPACWWLDGHRSGQADCQIISGEHQERAAFPGGMLFPAQDSSGHIEAAGQCFSRWKLQCLEQPGSPTLKCQHLCLLPGACWHRGQKGHFPPLVSLPGDDSQVGAGVRYGHCSSHPCLSLAYPGFGRSRVLVGEPAQPGCLWLKAANSQAAAALCTGSAPALSPNASHQQDTASGVPKVLYVPPQGHPHLNYHPTIARSSWNEKIWKTKLWFSRESE